MGYFVVDIYSHHFYKKFLNQENLYFLFSQASFALLDREYIEFEDLKLLTILHYCKRDLDGVPIITVTEGEGVEVERYTIPPKALPHYNKEMNLLKKVYFKALVRQMDLLLTNLN